jgi:sedoheptulose-bisphosphatase
VELSDLTVSTFCALLRLLNSSTGLIQPENICHVCQFNAERHLDDINAFGQVFVSPRQRAQTTFYTLFEGQELPPHETTESVAEWNYGDYEGLLATEIKQKNPTWEIWKDGCPGGESVEDVTKRIDEMIAKVREYHRLYKEEGKGKRDSAF